LIQLKKAESAENLFSHGVNTGIYKMMDLRQIIAGKEKLTHAIRVNLDPKHRRPAGMRIPSRPLNFNAWESWVTMAPKALSLLKTVSFQPFLERRFYDLTGLIEN
jgi:hypothetical protein